MPRPRHVAKPITLPPPPFDWPVEGRTAWALGSLPSPVTRGYSHRV
jgi:hypothetical protein